MGFVRILKCESYCQVAAFNAIFPHLVQGGTQTFTLVLVGIDDVPFDKQVEQIMWKSLAQVTERKHPSVFCCCFSGTQGRRVCAANPSCLGVERGVKPWKSQQFIAQSQLPSPPNHTTWFSIWHISRLSHVSNVNRFSEPLILGYNDYGAGVSLFTLQLENGSRVEGLYAHSANLLEVSCSMAKLIMIKSLLWMPHLCSVCQCVTTVLRCKYAMCLKKESHIDRKLWLVNVCGSLETHWSTKKLHTSSSWESMLHHYLWTKQ